jgi:hypothetical protein
MAEDREQRDNVLTRQISQLGGGDKLVYIMGRMRRERGKPNYSEINFCDASFLTTNPT